MRARAPNVSCGDAGRALRRSLPSRPPRGLLRAAWIAAVLGATACAPAPPPRAAPPPAKTGAVTELRVTAEGVEAQGLLASDAQRAAEAGAGALHMIGADLVSEGDRVGAFIHVPDDECVLVLSRASASVADADLFAFEDDGSLFASDEAPDAHAALLLCPPHPRRLYVMARVMSGAGLLGVGVQSVPRAAADAVARVARARGRPGDESGRMESWPGLEAKLRDHRAWLGSRWEDVRRLVLPVGPRVATRTSINVEAGRCVDVLASPSDEVGSLEVVAEDASARIVARARERGRDRVLVLCSGAPAEVTIAIRSRATQGLVALVVGRSPVGAEREIVQAATVDRVTATLELPEARAVHAKRIEGRGYAAAKTIGTGAVRAGSRSSVPVELPKGCARIDVIAGRPLAEIAAELWDEHGVLLADSRGGAAATLFACGPARSARLDVEALAHPGPFAVELRQDRAAPPVLVAHPVAAGRLLDRLDAGGQLAGAAVAADAQVVALDAVALKRLPAILPAGGCVEVVAALDHGGSGVELRLVDGATGESTLSRGREVVADRICAGDRPTPAAVEVRLAAGKTDALVLVRILPP